MVSEIRHLLFRPFEVVQAVAEFSRRSGVPLPPGTVVRCEPENNGTGTPIRFRIAIAPDGTDPTAETSHREITIDSSTLAAALILYCRDRRIPLPASADKSLQQFGDQVCLMATINPKQDAATATIRLEAGGGTSSKVTGSEQKQTGAPTGEPKGP